MSTLTNTTIALGKSLGFDIVGITTAERFARDEQAALERVSDGLMDGLPWYTAERVRKANSPRKLLEDARSVVSLAMSYNYGEAEPEGQGPHGKIARYAWGEDYHEVMKKRLREFVGALPDLAGRPVNTRIFVDDGPMNDRAAAERAGVGWFGKNTNILNPTYGSWLLLGQVITDLDLVPDAPLKKNCGECVRCIDDCPTGAIVAPYVIDNRKCISFLTIELRGPIPRDLRPLVGDWIFGCDICQDVCPVNWKAAPALEPAFRKRHDFDAPTLLPLLELDDEGFRERFRGSPIKRAKRVGLQRNVCVALGNIGDPVAVPALAKVLESDEPLLREHAAWALGKIGTPEARAALLDALFIEDDLEVKRELIRSIGAIDLARTPPVDAESV
ncbi:MAG: tRNA epoxyqueuosine(34) reductase QueG [Dehalococcoidia bacterium]|nr:tRNA epoxyqueuosine(34) reductase QueG [Dehalococcoidia bacterium]